MSADSDMVERVARAMMPEAWEPVDGQRCDLIRHQVARSKSLRCARAAIDASGIGELVETLCHVRNELYLNDAGRTIQLIERIDAALSRARATKETNSE